jgi:hypothetical protein
LNDARVIRYATALVGKTFPKVDPWDFIPWLILCAKNEGLALFPEDKPDFCFGYFRYWPTLVKAVEDLDINTLKEVSLIQGPILHIMVLVTPTKGYRLTRELIEQLNPLAVSCHRYRKDGSRTFHFKRNPRFSGERIHESLH